MPGLIAFRRRWRIGSDDFVFPALIELVIRVFWFVAIFAVFLKNREKAHKDCQEGQRLLHIYLIVSLIGLLFIILLDGMITWVSSRGTITQIRPRRHLPKILYFRLIITFMEIAWNAVGTMWAFIPKDHICESRNIIIVLQVVVICSWIIVTVTFIGMVIFFDPTGHHSHVVDSHRIHDIEHGSPQALYINVNSAASEQAKKKWEWRLSIFCCFCCVNDDRSKNAYSEIAKLFADYFEDIDLVPSDVVVGLILLSQKQATESIARSSTSHPSEHFSVQSPDSMTSTGALQGSVVSSPGVFTPLAHNFWMTVEMAYHFMTFAQASYGWPMFLYAEGLSGICKLMTKIRCCACCCKPPSYIVDDNCCHCHTAALRYVTGVAEEDLIYVSFHNRIYEVPFYVAVDHQTCSIVVAIRGTLSLLDAVTDLTAECDILVTDSCPQGLHCHRGMLRAAQFVRHKLDESHALSDAFALHQSYSLVITGHSLGGGTATLLATLLRPIYPNLRCFAFSPPGGLLNIEGVKHTEDFVFSVVLGDDLVPRLSVPNLEYLKKRLLSCIMECDQPKYKIFLARLSSCFGKIETPKGEIGGNHQIMRPLLDRFSQNSGNNNSYTVNNSQEGSSDGSGNNSQMHSQPPRQISYVLLQLPGRILHITRSNSSFQAHWVSADFFNQIIISPSMIADHFPNQLSNALKQLISDSGNFIP